MRFVDRRLVGWGELEGPDAFVEILTGWSRSRRDLHIDAELLGVGTGAAGGPASVPRSSRGRRRARSRSRRRREPDRRRAGHVLRDLRRGRRRRRVSRASRRSARRPSPSACYARSAASCNARDWEALGDCYAEDYELIDRRALGWEPLRGRRRSSRCIRSWVELVPDVEVRFETLAGDDAAHRDALRRLRPRRRRRRRDGVRRHRGRDVRDGRHAARRALRRRRRGGRPGALRGAAREQRRRARRRRRASSSTATSLALQRARLGRLRDALRARPARSSTGAWSAGASSRAGRVRRDPHGRDRTCARPAGSTPSCWRSDRAPSVVRIARAAISRTAAASRGRVRDR